MKILCFDILHSFADSIAIIDSSGKIVFTNKTWNEFSSNNSGIAECTGIGINYLNVCSNATEEELLLAKKAAVGIRQVIEHELPAFELEYPCHSATEERWFIMRCTRLATDDEHCIISHINVTNRKLAEANVEQQNSTLTEINSRLESTVYKIAHDIQAPLSSVEGIINLSKVEGTGAAANIYLALIEKSVAQLRDFLRETVQLSALGNQVESLNLKDIVDKYYESIKHAAQSHNITINTSFKQNSPFFSVKSKVVSIFSNLIDNSLKYYDPAKAKPVIELSAEVNNQEAVITIRDNGIGIPAELTEKIFDLNFRVDSGNDAGSGLGLYIIKKTIADLQGTIQVTSTLNEETQFVVKIPNMQTTKKESGNR